MFKKENKNENLETQNRLSSSASIRQQFNVNVEFEIRQIRNKTGADNIPRFKIPKSLEEQKEQEKEQEKILDDFNREWRKLMGKEEIPQEKIPQEKIPEASIANNITLGFIDKGMENMKLRRKANKLKRSQSVISEEHAKTTVHKRSHSMSNS